MKSFRIAFYLSLTFAGLICIRLWGVGEPPFLFDEMFSLYVSKHPEWRALFFDSHPPLYHIFLKFYLQMASLNEFWVRVPSAVFVAIADVAFLKWAHKRWDLRVVFFLGLLILASAPAMRMSHLVRPYGLFYLFSSLQIMSFLDCESKASQGWKFYLLSLLMLLTHSLAIPILAFEIIWSLIQKRNWRPLLGLLIVAAALCVAEVNLDYLQWTKVMYDPVFLQHTLFGFFYQIFFQTWYLSIFALISVILFWKSVKKMRQQKDLYFLMLFLLFHLLGLQILAFIFQGNPFLPRFTAFLALPFLAILAHFLATVSHHRFGKYLAMLFVATYIAAFVQWFPERFMPRRLDYQKVVAAILENGPGPILTTQSAALQTPYFENVQLQIEKISDAHLMEEKIYQLMAENKNHQKVYVLESYSGLLPYWEPLMTALRLNRYRLHMTEFSSERGDNAFLLSIENPEH